MSARESAHVSLVPGGSGEIHTIPYRGHFWGGKGVCWSEGMLKWTLSVMFQFFLQRECIHVFFIFIFLNLFLFIYFWLHWVFVALCGLSLVVESGGCSAVVEQGLSCSAACGIFPGQGSNPCPLPWQADSQPLRHQGSPHVLFLYLSYAKIFPRAPTNSNTSSCHQEVSQAPPCSEPLPAGVQPMVAVMGLILPCK